MKRILPIRVLALIAVMPLMIGCGQEERNAKTSDTLPATGSADSAATAPTILFLGTSLTAGYGLPSSQAFPALIDAKIDSAGLEYRVVNAGLSGETSAGALRRLDWLLRQPFEVLVLETGANDMLRGTNLDVTKANIQAIIDRLREARPGADIILAGMKAPPNLGTSYTREFREIYPELSDENDLVLIPFLLEGVAGVPALNQPDGIHPNEEGQEIVAANVWSTLEPVLTP